MNINDLPNECLFTIFNYIADLSDLYQLYKVCVRWSELIRYRFREVKYLIAHHKPDKSHSMDTLYFDNHDTLMEINLVQLFPYIKILTLTEPLASFMYSSPTTYRIYHDKSQLVVSGSDGDSTIHRRLDYANKKVIKFVSKLESVRGLFYSLRDCCTNSYLTFCKNLEMIAVGYYIDDHFSIGGNGIKVKQLSIYNYSTSRLIEDGDLLFFPNLKRLQHFNYQCFGTWIGNENFNCPNILGLEVLELSLGYTDEPLSRHSGLNVMDLCPSLKSALHIIEFRVTHVNEWIKNYNLEDLVLQYLQIHTQGYHDWFMMRKFLRKYPNLKHLAIRGNQEISDKNTLELVKLLPKLVLLDLRGSRKITQQSVYSVEDYCKRTCRSLKIYIDGDDSKIRLDWPNLSTDYQPICKEWDFMKHCFLKEHLDRSSLWDSVEDEM